MHRSPVKDVDRLQSLSQPLPELLFAELIYLEQTFLAEVKALHVRCILRRRSADPAGYDDWGGVQTYLSRMLNPSRMPSGPSSSCMDWRLGSCCPAHLAGHVGESSTWFLNAATLEVQSKSINGCRQVVVGGSP
ncbi:hypothetical protein KC345_g154 [Hortaea werneckii]|nr:hypothetical protein KC345_g154 [Hortaea werneckii]